MGQPPKAKPKRKKPKALTKNNPRGSLQPRGNLALNRLKNLKTTSKRLCRRKKDLHNRAIKNPTEWAGFYNRLQKKRLGSLLFSLFGRGVSLPVADKARHILHLRAELFAGSEKGFVNCCFQFFGHCSFSNVTWSQLPRTEKLTPGSMDSRNDAATIAYSLSMALPR